MPRKSIVMVVLTTTIILTSCIVAYASSVSFNSQGRIIFTYNDSDPSNVVIFDAKDFETLYNVCK